jgi:hypothetical protein
MDSSHTKRLRRAVQAPHVVNVDDLRSPSRQAPGSQLRFTKPGYSSEIIATRGASS